MVAKHFLLNMRDFMNLAAPIEISDFLISIADFDKAQGSLRTGLSKGLGRGIVYSNYFVPII
jgi:hypothetical protein